MRATETVIRREKGRMFLMFFLSFFSGFNLNDLHLILVELYCNITRLNNASFAFQKFIDR